MALEGRDISDSEILEATRQVTNNQGKLQFQIDLPSGREITSEFFPEDLRKKAMMAWLDVVRQSRVDDAEEVRAKARRASEEAKRGALYPELGSLSPEGLSGSHESALIASQNGEGTSTGLATQSRSPSGLYTPAVAMSPTNASGMPPSLTVDPLAFANQALQRIQQELREVDVQLLSLVSRQQILTAQAIQWQTILNQFPQPPVVAPPSVVTTSEQTIHRKRRKDAGVPRAIRGTTNG